jgi:hypothetical protein
MSIKDLNVSLYNSKYLKYKNKYLTLKKMIGGGLTSSTVSKNDMPTDILGNIIRIARNESQHIPALISSDVNLQNRLHEDKVDIWEYKYILQRFTIKYTEKHSISNVFDNKEYNVIDLTIKRHSESSDDDLLAILNSLGNFNIIGNLCLRNNNITVIPQNFANIKVHGILDLRNNNIQVVPDNFSNIITDDVILDYKTERTILSPDLQNIRINSRKGKKIDIKHVCKYLPDLEPCVVQLVHDKIVINDTILSDEESMNLCIHIHVENRRIDDINKLVESGKLTYDEVKEVETFREIDKVNDQERNPVVQNKGGPMRGTNRIKNFKYSPYPSPKRHENIIKRSVRNIIPYVLRLQGDTNEYGINFSELFWSFSF